MEHRAVMRVRLGLGAWLLLSAVAVHAGEVSQAATEAVAREGEVRVMVTLAPPGDDGASRAALAAQVDALLGDLPSGARLARRFETVAALALVVDATGLAALAASPRVERVDLDVGGHGGLAQGLPLARVDVVRAQGFDGAGTKVVVIDSGVRLDHLAFAGRVVGEACFCSGGGGCCPNGGSTQTGPGSGANSHPHGTNVAGIAVGAGGVPGVPGGAAGSAAIVTVRVLDANNSFCCSSDVVAALDWVRVNHPDARVANLSLGTVARFAGDCDQVASFTQAMAAAINGLVAQGTTVTVSSGNNGSSVDMQAPACIANALSVAAVYDAAVGSQSFGSVCTAPTTAADQVTCFSNLSTSTDLAAPGAPITAAGTSSPTGASTFSGTSMAAPTVGGCAALLYQARPGATPAEVEAAMKASPTRVQRAGMTQDYPRLDCADALQRLPLTPGLFANGFESGATP